MLDSIVLNSSETDKLSNDLSNLETDIVKSLSDMSNIMVRISSFLEGDLSDSIISKFGEFESQFSTISSNMMSYVNDFKKLVVRFDEQNIDIKVDSANIAKKGGDLVNVNN